MFKFFILLTFLSFSLFAEDALKCELINKDDILKIKCKYNTISKDYDRNVSMAWTSPSTPQDDRFKIILLPAYNISVYDYRYFDGRADGSWTISATDEETGQVTITQFVKEDLSEANTMSSPCNSSSLTKPKK
ncbi:MAG: hypothetical protein COA44_00015 [Arcobacter sp.]|nr:MAG: hypothetical protein COA44_00015 [Arcobacter sp.]